MEDPFDSLKNFVCDDFTDHTPTHITREGWKWSEDQHARHRERMIGNDYNKGKSHCQETRDRISEANTGKKRTPEVKAAQSKMRTGKTRVPDDQASRHTLYMREYRKRKLNHD